MVLLMQTGIKLIPRKSVVLSTAGILKSKKGALSAEKLRRLAEEAISMKGISRVEP